MHSPKREEGRRPLELAERSLKRLSTSGQAETAEEDPPFWAAMNLRLLRAWEAADLERSKRLAEEGRMERPEAEASRLSSWETWVRTREEVLRKELELDLEDGLLEEASWRVFLVRRASSGSSWPLAA